MDGPGKYDDLCTYVREKSDALAVIVLIIGGRLGNGFSVQATHNIEAELPGMLRATAKSIEEDLNRPSKQ